MMLRASLALVVLVSLVSLGCSGGSRARDVAGDRRLRGAPRDAGAAAATATVPEAPPPAVAPAPTGKKARMFVRAGARALAVNATNLYYGDSETDALYAAPKAGGEPVRLARHAPVAGAIVLDAESVIWTASPGDAVLKLPLEGGEQPTVLRDRGIFSDVALANGDVFITEALGAGGALIRVTGPTASRLASFDGAPRAVMADATHAYVITPTKIFRTPHERGELETIATGVAFSQPQLDDGFIYVLTEVAKVRIIARIPKTGGPEVAIARDVRDAPFDVQGGEVIYLDATRPQVRATPTRGGDVRIVCQDDVLAVASALVVDASSVFVATGSRESGGIVVLDRH